MSDSLTPMMQQYRELKARDPDALLLFRMGDFYELFGDDAERASTLLGLTLTSRDKGPDALPMAGFPHSALDSYLAKIVQSGLRRPFASKSKIRARPRVWSSATSSELSLQAR